MLLLAKQQIIPFIPFSITIVNANLSVLFTVHKSFIFNTKSLVLGSLV